MGGWGIGSHNTNSNALYLSTLVELYNATVHSHSLDHTWNSLMNSSAQYLSVYTLYSVTLVTLIGWFQIRDSSAAQQWCFVCFFNLPLASGPNSLPKVPRGRFRENSQFFWTDPLILYFRKILIYFRTFFFFGPLFIFFSGIFFFFTSKIFSIKSWR
jgi:hypothetical protein